MFSLGYDNDPYKSSIGKFNTYLNSTFPTYTIVPTSLKNVTYAASDIIFTLNHHLYLTMFNDWLKKYHPELIDLYKN